MVLQLNDGTQCFITRDLDLFHLIEEKMGTDVRYAVEDLLSARGDDEWYIGRLEQEQKKTEARLSSARKHAGAAMRLLTFEHPDREKLYKEFEAVWEASWGVV